jgi:hypothetical protein
MRWGIGAGMFQIIQLFVLEHGISQITVGDTEFARKSAGAKLWQ